MEEEKREDKEEEEKPEPKNVEKQTKIIFVVMGILIIGLLFFAWISYSMNNFTYHGFDFEKTKTGNLIIFRTRITGYNIVGNPMDFYFNLRNDPRELNDIPADNIQILKGNNISVTVSGDIECQNSYVALLGLGIFLGQAEMGYNVESGIAEGVGANENDMSFITCDNRENTVLVVKPGDETEIVRTSQNCYEIRFANCEILEAIERFEVATITSFEEF